MLRAFVSFLAVFLAAGFTACGSCTGSGANSKAIPATERKGKIIRITDAVIDAGGTDTVRFGRMHSGEIAVQQVWLANDAARATAIISYDRTCGCTTLAFEPQPIAPGDAQRIQITFDSRGERGWQLKRLNLHLADTPKPLRIFVEAEVE